MAIITVLAGAGLAMGVLAAYGAAKGALEPKIQELRAREAMGKAMGRAQLPVPLRRSSKKALLDERAQDMRETELFGPPLLMTTWELQKCLELLEEGQPAEATLVDMLEMVLRVQGHRRAALA